MFCPNCGNNCGDAKFCTACGTQLKVHNVQEQQPKEMQKKAWVEGTPCPYCGGMQIENGKCMFCGVQLNTKQTNIEHEKELPVDIPCGMYKGIMSSLTLYEKEFVVYNRVSLLKKFETRIPYDKLTAVKYVRTDTVISRVIFRWEGNENVPIPNVNEMRKDPTAVAVSQSADRLFYSAAPPKEIYDVNNDMLFFHIFYMLKAIAPKSAQFCIEIYPVNDSRELQNLAAKTDLDFYYDRYAPYRDQAIKELRKRTGAKETLATELINQIFDKRQEDIYSAEPIAAMRDLNLIIADKTQRKEEAMKEAEKRRERNRQDALLYELEHKDED